MTRRPSETKAHLRELLACALRHVQVDAEGRPLEGVIPYRDAKKMTAEQVRSLFQFDHAVHHAIDGPAEHWNLTPRLIADHRQKTKADVKQLAKTKRLALAREAFEEVMARKGGGVAPHQSAPGEAQLALPSTREAQRSRWASRPMPGTKRSGLKKRMNGKVEKR